jgi:hypothetical protein
LADTEQQHRSARNEEAPETNGIMRGAQSPLRAARVAGAKQIAL